MKKALIKALAQRVIRFIIVPLLIAVVLRAAIEYEVDNNSWVCNEDVDGFLGSLSY
jgi:hypothetical protein